MKNCIYVLFNSLTNRYQTVFEAATDTAASVGFSRNMANNPDYQYLEICKIAEYDIKNGTVEALPAPVRVPKQVLDTEKPIDGIESSLTDNN